MDKMKESPEAMILPIEAQEGHQAFELNVKRPVIDTEDLVILFSEDAVMDLIHFIRHMGFDENLRGRTLPKGVFHNTSKYKTEYPYIVAYNDKSGVRRRTSAISLEEALDIQKNGPPEVNPDSEAKHEGQSDTPKDQDDCDERDCSPVSRPAGEDPA